MATLVPQARPVEQAGRDEKARPGKKTPVWLYGLLLVLLVIGGVFAKGVLFPAREGPKTEVSPPSSEGRKSPFTNSIGMRFAHIPPGAFMMGSPSHEEGRSSKDETQHRVTLTTGFHMGVTEVTQGQWKAVMGSNSNPSDSKNCGDDCPVENVSWEDCQEFIRRLNQKEGTDRYRLPTEAEWEYACRAGTTGPYAGDLDSMGWYGRNSGKTTHPVGQKRPNAWGLYDMHGNVWEWVHDWYGKDYYVNSPSTDPKGPSGGSSRVIRGGSWRDVARHCRSAIRSPGDLGFGYNILGFRLSRSLP